MHVDTGEVTPAPEATERDEASEIIRDLFGESRDARWADPSYLATALYDRIVAAIDAAVAEAVEGAAKVADEKAAECRQKRVTPGDLERNYFGGGMAAASSIAAAIRARSPGAA